MQSVMLRSLQPLLRQAVSSERPKVVKHVSMKRGGVYDIGHQSGVFCTIT